MIRREVKLTTPIVTVERERGKLNMLVVQGRTVLRSEDAAALEKFWLAGAE